MPATLRLSVRRAFAAFAACAIPTVFAADVPPTVTPAPVTPVTAINAGDVIGPRIQIGRASCRERVSNYV